MPRQPRSRNRETKVSEELSMFASSQQAERRRERYEERQDRLRGLRHEENYAQRRELYEVITAQSRGIQQYAAASSGGSDPAVRLNDMVETAENLIVNIQRMQQLGRDAYSETRSYSQQTLAHFGERRRDYLIELERNGSSERTLRLFLRRTEERRRTLQQQIQRLQDSFQEEDENMESLQGQVRRVIEHFRERDRYIAVRSAFLEPAALLTDCEKGYRSSMGRIRKSNSNSKCAADVCCQDIPCDGTTGLFAHFGDHDVTPIDHGTCAICLFDYQEEDVIVRNAITRESQGRCHHLFHEKCVTLWIESSRKAECPCCRQPFVVKTSSGS